MKTLVIVSTVPDERAEMTLKTANALGYHTVFAATSPMISSINGSAGRVSGDEHAVTRVSKLAGIFAEELLMSVKEKNPAGAKIDAEMMVILDDAGVRLIQRDSGVLFDIMEGDSELSSFRDYIISRTVTLSEYKSYMIATGYNRNEIYLSYQTDSLQI